MKEKLRYAASPREASTRFQVWRSNLQNRPCRPWFALFRLLENSKPSLSLPCDRPRHRILDRVSPVVVAKPPLHAGMRSDQKPVHTAKAGVMIQSSKVSGGKATLPAKTRAGYRNVHGVFSCVSGETSPTPLTEQRRDGKCGLWPANKPIDQV